MKKYLWKSLLYTFLASAFLAFLLIQIAFSKESDGLEAKQAVLLFAVAGVFWSLALSICSTTVFLNLYPQIRQNNFYRFTSYYVVPLLAVVLIVVTTYSPDSPKMTGQFLISNIPFFAVHTCFFIDFSRTTFE
jgi:cytochrome bd-type quinol oxidase subunit 2